MKVIEDYCKDKTLQEKLNFIEGICLAMSIYLNQNDSYNPLPEIKKSFEYGNYLIKFGYISYDGNVWTYFLGRYSNE